MECSWTDFFFLLTLIFLSIGFLFSLRKPRAREDYKKLMRRPLAMMSGVILLFFLSIGVIDSLHFPASEGNTTHVVSLLDKILSPLGSELEKTYSAPFASTLFIPELKVVQGETREVYPQLKYPSTNVTHKNLIAHLYIKSLLSSLAITAFFYALFLYSNQYQHKKVIKLNPGAYWACITIFFCISLCLWSFWLSRHYHILGTNKIGQDIFYLTLKSIRTGLVIGILTTVFTLPLALILGIAAGYFGGIIDDIIQYIYITLSSIPGILLITASVLSLQTYIANHPQQFSNLDSSADARLLALCIILGVTSWTSLCRLLRAETLKLRTVDFVYAAKALGSRTSYILFTHLLPNVMPIVLITIALDFSFLVLAEAVLSYVGVGVSPMTISWGNMINSARLELARDPIVWWPILAAFLGMFVLVLANNLFADAVNKVLDPRGEL